MKYQLNEALKHFNQEDLVSDAQIITEDDAVWRSVAAMPLQLNATFGWRTTVLPGKLAGFLHKVREIYGEPFDSLCGMRESDVDE